MIPGNYILRLRRGDYWRKRFRFQDPDTLLYYDFAGSTGRAQVRATEDDLTALIEATVTVGTDATGHYVEVYFPATQTNTLTVFTGLWDLEMTDATGPLTWLAGAVVVTKDVSRAP